jgi:hypothetical protein
MRPQQRQSLGFHTETPSCKTSTNLTVYGCSAQAQVSQWRNGFHTLFRFSLFRSFIAKRIYLHGSRSGFEPESPVHFRIWTWIASPFQDLNLNLQSISWLEPESPVHFMTWTWIASPFQDLNLNRQSISGLEPDRQSISGLEPESPVHFKTWTWIASPFQDLNLKCR